MPPSHTRTRPAASAKRRCLPGVTMAVLGLLVVAAVSPAAASGRVLRVCSDPTNLPYSNDRGEGFEDKIATLIAADLHATVEYTWGMQRLGFLRRTLQAHACDVVMGISAGVPSVVTTRPYYRSAYVFVSTRERNLQLASFDDPVLRGLKIGLHAIASDGNNPPPAHSIAARDLGANVVGFKMYDDEEASPAGRIVDAVADGTIDVAVVWGPFAGYFGKPYRDRLAMTPILADPALPEIPYSYAIAIGVRKADTALRDELDGVLARRQAEITAILTDYDVPLVTAPN